MRTRTASFRLRCTIAGLAILLAACSPDVATAPSDEAPLARAAAVAVATADAGGSGLASIRAATAKYHRVEQAVADGYVSTVECVALPPSVSPGGAMGIHYVNATLRGSVSGTGGHHASFDPLRPEVLVYEPQKSGKMRLVAVEYFIWRAPWDAANSTTTPSLLGQPFFRSFQEFGTNHGAPDHYELHVWLWQHNPSGMFAQWNPTVSCPVGN